MNRREILFRGKRVDNGEWVQGSYVQDKEWARHGIYQLELRGAFYQLVRHEINPPTIGQFTGLTDSKGNKVFEGDIESSGGVVRLGIYEMFSDRSGFPTWIAERKNGASFVLVCDNEFKIRETIIGTIHDTHLTQQS